MTELATLRFDIDMDSDGVYGEAGDNVTSDVLLEPGYGEFRCERGREQMRSLSPPKAGAADFAIRNSGSYGPTSNVKRGRGVRVQATYSAVTYELWRGRLDYPTREPGLLFKRVLLPCNGMFTRLIGQEKLSTALYSNIDTGTAMGHVLDAAGWPKNLPDHITADLLTGLAGYWRLGESSGVAEDSSVNNNDGTVTLGAGSRDFAALDDGGDGCIDFDGAATLVSIADNAAIQNIWDGGGSAFFMFNADSAGEGGAGQVIAKAGGWLLTAFNQSGANFALRLFYTFSGTDATWDTAINIPISTTVIGVLVYNNGATTNDPTLYLWNGTTLSTLTVGSGLTEITTPTGTRDTDVGNALIIGNNSGATQTFNGRIDEVALWKGRTLTATEAGGLIARARARERVLDTGKTILDWWWLDQGDPWEEIKTLLATEGPGSVVYEDGQGRFIFKNRHARLLEARSTVSQGTFGTGGAFMLGPANYEDGLRNVINICEIETKIRSAKPLDAVWTLGETLNLGPNDVRTIIASNSDPFTAAVAPVLTTDYTVASGSLTSVTIDRTSGASVTITITAGASGAVVEGLQLRAQLVSVDATTRVINTIDTSTSQNDHGKRPFKLPVRPEFSQLVAQDFCNAVVDAYENGNPIIEFGVPAGYSLTEMTHALAREISDRIVINETTIPISSEAYYIEQIKHSVQYGGGLHVTTFGCEKTGSLNYFILDTSQLDGAAGLGF